jgi:Transglutaminase-like superfamily
MTASHQVELIPARLADADDPLVRKTAARLIQGCGSQREEVERLAAFVRDDIAFGFPPNGDITAASETLRLGVGQCNTKGTLLLALCTAAEIHARLHFAPIRRSIQRGLYTGLWYSLLPRHLSHSWLEVDLDGEWKRLDAYINDQAFGRGAAHELKRRGWREGFSLSDAADDVGRGGFLDGNFVQMAAVEGDDGTWTEPADYYRSALYRNRVGPIRAVLYRLALPAVNRRIESLRETGFDSGVIGGCD